LGLSQPELGPNVRGSQNAHFASAGLEGLTVSYPLLNDGSILGINDPSAVAMARANRDQQTLANVITEQRVIILVVTDYIYIWDSRAQVATAQKMIELATKQLGIIHTQVKLGLKLPQQIEFAEAQLAAANQTRQMGIDGENASSGDLAGRIGLKESELQLENTELPLPELELLDHFLDLVMPDHPALHQQQAKVELARQRLKVDEADYWPTVTLESNLSTAQDLEYFNGSMAHTRPTPVSFILNH
jgi:outer membrane protein TolC